MKRKYLVIGIILLFMASSIVPVIAQDAEKPLPTSRGNWFYVGGSGPGNYTMIQNALDNASEGDTVFVYGGIYYENVDVNTNSIHLVGENKDTTIIDGGGTGNVVNVTSDGATISNFTVQNSGSWSYAGITLFYSNANIIKDNNITNNNGGIQFISSSNNIISDNNVNSNNNNAIYLRYSNNNSISNNNAINNGYGIYLVSSNNISIITNNVNSNNHIGIYLRYSNNSSIITNNVNSNNNIGIYQSQSKNNILTGNDANSNSLYGILLESSNNNIVTNNDANLNNNGFGIGLSSSNNNILISNIANSNTYYGILIDTSINNDIKSSIAHSNGLCGISLESSNTNNITDNILSNNDCGIFLYYSSNNNHLYHNNLIHNNYSSYDDGINIWDNGYPSGGNYWSDYTGIDANGDGIGDTPYNITGGSNQDLYPFIEQNGWLNEPPNSPTITGPATGKIKVAIAYNFTTTDPNNNYVYYFIDWGDSTNSSWIGIYHSGEKITKSHTWTKKGDYTIKAKAKDIYGNESGWGTLTVTMPFSYNIPLMNLWMKLFERFPNAFPILRYLLEVI